MNEPARLYYSERHIPLVYVDQPGDKPIVTVENYMKWYNLYEILPSGAVRCANFHDDDTWNHEVDGPIWSDHVPNPKAVEQFAAYYNYILDENALDMIRGRWDEQRDIVRTLVACDGGCGKGIVPKYRLCVDCAAREIVRLEAIIDRLSEGNPHR